MESNITQMKNNISADKGKIKRNFSAIRAGQTEFEEKMTCIRQTIEGHQKWSNSWHSTFAIISIVSYK
jgi:hypothetical protein